MSDHIINGEITEAGMQRAEELDGKATKGPWESDKESEMYYNGKWCITCPVDREPFRRVFLTFNTNFEENVANDNAYVCESRLLLPAAIQRIRRLERELSEAKAKGRVEGLMEVWRYFRSHQKNRFKVWMNNEVAAKINKLALTANGDKKLPKTYEDGLREAASICRTDDSVRISNHLANVLSQLADDAAQAARGQS